VPGATTKKMMKPVKSQLSAFMIFREIREKIKSVRKLVRSAKQIEIVRFCVENVSWLVNEKIRLATKNVMKI
jgi:hypothetical protein